MKNVKIKYIPLVIVSCALLYTTISGMVTTYVFNKFNIEPWNYGKSTIAVLSDICAMLIAWLAISRTDLIKIFDLREWIKKLQRVLLWAGLIFIPVILVLYFTVPIAKHMKTEDLAYQGIFFPITEEIVYRGLAIIILIRFCGINKYLACIYPAVFFGIVHFWQGDDLGSILGIVAITAAGGLLFGWLFLKWGNNLFAPILLHIGMNLQWSIFDLGTNAIGGINGNIARLWCVVAAIGLSLVLSSAKRSSSSET